jgi:hypothetical protein
MWAGGKFRHTTVFAGFFPFTALIGGRQPYDNWMNRPPGPKLEKAASINPRRLSVAKFNRGKPETIADILISRGTCARKFMASPLMIVADGKRLLRRSTKYSPCSIAMRRWAAIPRCSRAVVTTPVPGPNSSTWPIRSGSTWSAIALASTGLEGVGAETPAGSRSSPSKKSLYDDKPLCPLITLTKLAVSRVVPLAPRMVQGLGHLRRAFGYPPIRVAPPIAQSRSRRAPLR